MFNVWFRISSTRSVCLVDEEGCEVDEEGCESVDVPALSRSDGELFEVDVVEGMKYSGASERWASSFALTKDL